MNNGNLTRNELIELAHKFLNAPTEKEGDELYNYFNMQFSHPDTANLFFYPEDYNARKTDLSSYEPSAEEIVDIGLAHKPIQL